MQCPNCGDSNLKVADSRNSGQGIRRRRVCQGCGARFTTHERIERKLPLVKKKGGSREPFERDKVLAGFRLACRKRPVSGEALDDASERVENAVVHIGGPEISSEEIGKLVMAELKELDKVGYLRFASVYQEIQDPMEFLEILRPTIEESR